MPTIRRADIRQLIEAAIARTRYPGTTPEEFYRELSHRIGEEGLGVFIGFTDDEAKALAIALLPASALMMAPQIALVYSAGKPPLGRAVARRLKEWIMAHGYDRVLGINLHRRDDVFMTGTRHLGTPRRLGSLIEWVF